MNKLGAVGIIGLAAVAYGVYSLWIATPAPLAAGQTTAPTNTAAWAALIGGGALFGYKALGK